MQKYATMVVPEGSENGSDKAGEQNLMTSDSAQPSQGGMTTSLAPQEGANLYTAQSADGEKRYAAWVSVTEEEIGTLLDGYEGTQSFDAVSGETFTRYELTKEEFDAIVAQLENPQITVDDTSGTELYSIAVYP